MIIANLSGGRNSVAMVIKWLELGNKLDYIIFCDTGFKFADMYKYINMLDDYLHKEFNKRITWLNPLGKKKESNSYTILEDWAFHKHITRGKHKGKLRGLPMRISKDYCSRETKINPTKEFLFTRSKNKFANTCLVGHTYDDVESGKVSKLDYAIAKYPLHEWRMNEKETTEFLVKRRIMNPLYNHFDRTGCYICPKQSIKSLYHIYKYYPDEWERMKALEAKARSLNCVNQSFKDRSLLKYESEFKSRLDLNFDDIYTEHETCFCDDELVRRKDMKSKDFKFRVWDNKTKEFLKDPLLSECEYRECENLEIEIFTGLVDKNGKEIYENDILRNFFIEFKVTYNKHYSIFEIMGLPGEQGYIFPTYPLFQKMEFVKDSEVIGNIHFWDTEC